MNAGQQIDNIAAVESCIRVHDSGRLENEVINVGSDQEISILELAKLVLKIVGSKSKIEFLPPLKEGDMTRRCPDAAPPRLTIVSICSARSAKRIFCWMTSGVLPGTLIAT